MSTVGRSQSLLTKAKEPAVEESHQNGGADGEQLKRHQSLPSMALEASPDSTTPSQASSPDMFDDSDQEPSVQVLTSQSSFASSSQESESGNSSEDGIVIDIAYLR
ncbi:uncharacterized protein LOC123267130 [Cotesia glomerata]|uniref:Uncharacterized protein n=1 Tax=Cotesia glomerata TaxID=32391 RepID=A0AAV7HT32_COTGL|nr:uncharacterized protein LOC123267130 [Cotesia glomerata]KAH0534866.1 hypothetical protein KQX54_009429 [Cotesia glomerata]